MPPLAEPVASATILFGAAALTAISVLFCSSSPSGLGHPIPISEKLAPLLEDLKKEVDVLFCLTAYRT